MQMTARRVFTDEFKRQMVQLYGSGKPRKDVLREYSLTPSAFSDELEAYASKNHLSLTILGGIFYLLNINSRKIHLLYLLR